MSEIIRPWREYYGRSALWLILATFVTFLVWAAFSEVDEAVIGQGKVIPSSRNFVIQSLEPGILVQLYVREGSTVTTGQPLAALDPVQAQSALGEAVSKLMVLRAKAVRLEAEMAGRVGISFPEADGIAPEIQARERSTFAVNRQAYLQGVSDLERELLLARRELETVEPYLRSGAANSLEVLRIRQRIAELETKLSATRNQYRVGLEQEYSQTMAEIEPLLSVESGRREQVKRTVLRSPGNGLVNEIRTNTIGGVVPAGGEIMDLVPVDDQLLIETKISPRDIAFVRTGQAVNVKITAYDPSIFGALKGQVVRISADTEQDEVDRRVGYFRVYVKTVHNYLRSADGQHHAIVTGMTATTEIRTGKRTIMRYLLKPIYKAREALRER